MPRRIALYGGSFDPLHSAHKEIIKHLSKHFDLVILIPTNVTYYKANAPMFTFDDRCKVISDEISKYDNVVISTIEKNIPENWRFVDTLKNIVKAHVIYNDDIEYCENNLKLVDTQIYLAIGSDSLQNFKTWTDWKTILKLARLVVFNRPGYTDNLPDDIPYLYVPMNNPESSTRIRKLISQKN